MNKTSKIMIVVGGIGLFLWISGAFLFSSMGAWYVVQQNPAQPIATFSISVGLVIGGLILHEKKKARSLTA